MPKSKAGDGYSVRKAGDNYALCFRGLVVECGIFATRATAEKYKRIADHERRERTRGQSNAQK